MLPLPVSMFAESSTSSRKRDKRLEETKRNRQGAMGEEDGWEDGEDLGDDDLDVEGSHSEGEEDEEDEGGYWLEGRFQR